MKRDGFSLIELLITIAIIGILAAVAIPGYIGHQKRAERTEASTNLENLRLVLEQVFADTGQYVAANIGAAGTTRAIRTANWTAIRAALPRWQPGPAESMKYSYRIIANASLPAAPAVPLVLATIVSPTANCYVAVATGVDNTRVLGDIFAVDCNNNKNY
jgi:prepilin-type N-terminal cleavage/methylation domain-containing protein